MKKYYTEFDQIPLFVDVPFIAEILQISVQSIRTYIRDGRIKASKIGRQWRISKDEVLRIYETNGKL